jgi:hypothetical protein
VKELALLAIGMALHAAAAPAAAQSTLTLSGDPQAMVISTAEAGSQPNAVVDEGTSYSLVAQEILGIDAQLDALMPPGTSLYVQLEPPAASLGAGSVALDTSPRRLVSGIVPGTYNGLSIRYQLTATVEAGVVPMSSRTVTFTITTSP